MEQTFMTIHNLSAEANILFASDSIYDILGYQPYEVQDKPCFDYFHPEEIPFARSIHSRGVLLDKAAVLHYARIRSRDGRWVSCECCFTIVHDVLVACTSIYRRDQKSERRAIEAPHIRRLFSSSPRDPRYHMLEHLSPKFRMPPTEREPRAALILNRFTRTLNVMFATNAVASILGVRPEQVKGKSFYECIQENCLQDAISCLESAKANDSIAYLRFWYRDPRREEDIEQDREEDREEDEAAMESESTSDSDGGAQLYGNQMEVDGVRDSTGAAPHVKLEDSDPSRVNSSLSSGSHGTAYQSGSSSSYLLRGETDSLRDTHQGQQDTAHGPAPRRRRADPIASFELEAVVSCTSDGLVVVLRRARPPIPAAHPPLVPSYAGFENGLFAAPWGQQPIRPRLDYAPSGPSGHYPPVVEQDAHYNVHPPLLPQPMPHGDEASKMATAGGPPLDQLMRSIRDVAVFAWALVGINGKLVTHSRGNPVGEAQPPDGFPVWDPNAGVTSYDGPDNQATARWVEYDQGKMSDESTAGNFVNQSLSGRRLNQGPEGQIFGHPQQSRPGFGHSSQSDNRSHFAGFDTSDHPMVASWVGGLDLVDSDRVPSSQATTAYDRDVAQGFTGHQDAQSLRAEQQTETTYPTTANQHGWPHDAAATTGQQHHQSSETQPSSFITGADGIGFPPTTQTGPNDGNAGPRFHWP